jgi:hypothetical protein
MQYCEKIKYCNNIKHSKKKLVTAGNDPSISKHMRYSQYVNTVRTTRVVSTPIDYVNQVNIFISQYISKYNKNININLDNFYIFVQQYYIKRNVNNIIEDINDIVKIKETKNLYNDIDDDGFIKALNDWFNQYKTNNGVNINIKKFNTFILNLNIIIQQYSEDSNIIIMYLYDTTANFINGLITAEFYYNYLSRVFINLDKDYLSGLLAGIIPLMPIEKAYYLKNYANIVNPYGSIWPHYISNRPVKTNINFMKYN